MENEPGPTGENAVMNAGTAGNTDDTDWNADFFWNAGDADFFGTRMTQVTRIFFGTRMTRVTRIDRKSTRLNSSHIAVSRMPSSA